MQFSNQKIQNNMIITWAKELNRHFSKEEDIQMVSGYTKRCSTD